MVGPDEEVEVLVRFVRPIGAVAIERIVGVGVQRGNVRVRGSVDGGGGRPGAEALLEARVVGGLAKEAEPVERDQGDEGEERRRPELSAHPRVWYDGRRRPASDGNAGYRYDAERRGELQNRIFIANEEMSFPAICFAGGTPKRDKAEAQTRNRG